MLSAILNDAKLVNPKSGKTADRHIALKSLGHWVGDIHQPLHVSFEDDRGGNSIKVRGSCSGNLHATWDTCLFEHAVGSDPTEAATKLVDDLNPEQRTKWSASDPRDWANESFAVAESAAAKYCTVQGSACVKPDGDVTVNAAYLDANAPAIRQQLQKAGVRLAKLLDDIFAD